MKDLVQILKDSGLRVTPQRIAVLKELNNCNHPRVDDLYKRLKKNHPNIAIGTVYNILESFVNKGIIKKVSTVRDVMHYDSITKPHYHLCSSETDRIEDYFDDELNQIISEYLDKKNIEGFHFEEIKIQLIGKFNNE